MGLPRTMVSLASSASYVRPMSFRAGRQRWRSHHTLPLQDGSSPLVSLIFSPSLFLLPTHMCRLRSPLVAGVALDTPHSLDSVPHSPALAPASLLIRSIKRIQDPSLFSLPNGEIECSPRYGCCIGEGTPLSPLCAANGVRMGCGGHPPATWWCWCSRSPRCC